MHKLTFSQQLELFLIPIIFLCGQIFVFLFGLTFVGDETLELMVYPTFIGSLISIFLILVIDRKHSIKDFKQLEKSFRFLVLMGGGVLIPILFLQLVEILAIDVVFIILSLFFSIIGGSMIIMCFLLLRRSWTTRAPLK